MRPRGRIYGATLTAFAVALTAVALTTTGGGPGPLTANLWMDTNGGTCVRQASPAAYSDATACDSFKEAYDAASLGDTVRMVDGSTFTGYTNFSGGAGPGAEGLMDGPTKTSCGSSKVTFDAGTGVTVGGLDITDTGCLAFKDFTVGGETPASNDDKVVDLTRADHISFDNVDLDVQWKITDGLGVSGGSDDLVWNNSSFCCTTNEKLIQIDNFATPENQVDLTFDHDDVGNQVYSAATYCEPSCVPHAECWWIQDTTNLTISNTVTHDCISTGAVNWGGSGNNLNMHIVNTAWSQAYDWVNGVDVVPGPTVGYRGDTVGTFIQGDNLNGTGTIEYSVFAQNAVIHNWSALTWRGNIDAQTTCEGASVTYLYNRHAGADCSVSDVQDASALSSGRFVNAAGIDFRPANSGVAQVNAGDPSSCPATDLLGVTRPIGGTCDQGPYEGG